MRLVPSAVSMTWSSQILSYNVRGLAIMVSGAGSAQGVGDCRLSMPNGAKKEGAGSAGEPIDAVAPSHRLNDSDHRTAPRGWSLTFGARLGPRSDGRNRPFAVIPDQLGTGGDLRKLP